MRSVLFFICVAKCMVVFPQDEPMGKSELKGRIKTMTEYRLDGLYDEPEKSCTSFYDTSRLLVRKYCDDRKHEIFFVYDSFQRQTGMRSVINGETNTEREWHYNDKGQVVREVNNEKGSAVYSRIFVITYDEQGRKVRVETRSLDNKFLNHSQYEWKGDTVFYRNYERGWVVSYKVRVYDSAGNEVYLLVKDSPGGKYYFRYQMEYNAQGKQIKKTAWTEEGFWHQFEYEYDAAGQLVKSAFKNKWTDAPAEITTYEYETDAIGNVTKSICFKDGKFYYGYLYRYEYYE